jgi:glycosyltransferase involved in cell wall biosynthesis
VENSPNLDGEPVRPDPALTPTDLAYVGILAHGRLLREIVSAVRGRPDVTLRIAGFGPIGEEVEAVAAECDNIDFLGAVPVERGLQVMSAATIMFATYDPGVPNHRFSAPNKFAEALALGKPLIVCEGTSIDVQVRTSGFGEVIPYDADAFMESVDRIKADQALLERCRTEGPAYYAANHSWAANAARLSSVYQRVQDRGC